jgi:hypothetical protein
MHAASEQARDNESNSSAKSLVRQAHVRARENESNPSTTSPVRQAHVRARDESNSSENDCKSCICGILVAQDFSKDAISTVGRFTFAPTPTQG